MGGSTGTGFAVTPIQSKGAFRLYSAAGIKEVAHNAPNTVTYNTNRGPAIIGALSEDGARVSIIYQSRKARNFGFRAGAQMYDLGDLRFTDNSITLGRGSAEMMGRGIDTIAKRGGLIK